MCGRYTLSAPPTVLADLFGVDVRQNLPPRYNIAPTQAAPFAMAGLRERWHDKAHDEVLETFTIVTTEPNELVAPIHNRMPVILSPDDFEYWLDPETPGPAELLAPYPADELEAVPVSTWVNSPAHDDARCVEPVAARDAGRPPSP